MSDELKVSVIMPVRDGERWLAQAVESVLAQTLADFELVIVDDGSIDGSPAILSALSRCDDRLRVVQQPPEGLVTALNRALALARAPLVARLDSDDVALPERLACQVSCFSQFPALVLLGSWAEEIDDEGRCIGQMRPETEPERLAQILPHRNPFVHSSMMMRTSVVQKLGGYRQAFLGAEDLDLWLRLSECGEIANLSQPLVRYRRHRGNIERSLGVRQSFSVRLAQTASRARRSSGIDPADRLLEPPDWWAPDAYGQFYGEAAQLCRFLELADPKLLETGRIDKIRRPSLQQLLHLSHAEKRLACRSIFNLFAARRRPEGLSLGRLAVMLLVLLVGRVVYRLLKAGDENVPRQRGR
jgi:glycosyltransferase involved in cell wall biosynthesis